MTKRFSASSAAQLMQCHGSANLELAIPGYVEPQRDEMAGAKGVGTRIHDSFRALAHWGQMELDVLSMIMHHYQKLHWRKRRELLDDITVTETWAWMRSHTSSDDLLVSEILVWMQDLDKEERLPPQMLLYVQQTIEHLAQLLLDENPRFHEVIEESSITCRWLRSAPSTTPDLVIAKPRTLIVVDYKTGKIPVSAVDNDQMMFYVVSALFAYYKVEDFHRIQTIKVMIWQPGNFDEHEITMSDVDKWMQLAQAADNAIQRKDLTLRPGSACTFCPANPHSRGDKAPPYCPAMMVVLYPNNTDEEAVLDL